MAENSKIEWTDHTFNPWIGCAKVSPGCDNCYAETRMDKRFGVVRWGAGQPRRRTKTWDDPLKWDAKAKREGRRYRVFCASLADVFDNEVDPVWRAELFDLIYSTLNLDWLLLTKRIGNAAGMMMSGTCWSPLEPPTNLWLGATVVNQAEADRDIPRLLQIPAAQRFLSMEPLLGPVDIARLPFRAVPFNFDGPPRDGYIEPLKCGISWVIVGGESGPGARPMHPDWARSLRDQCNAAGVAFHFKQWGEWAPHPPTPGFDEGGALRNGTVRYLQGDGREPDGHFRRGDAAVRRVGKHAAGRLLDGRTWDEVPT